MELTYKVVKIQPMVNKRRSCLRRTRSPRGESSKTPQANPAPFKVAMLVASAFETPKCLAKASSIGVEYHRFAFAKPITCQLEKFSESMNHFTAGQRKGSARELTEGGGYKEDTLEQPSKTVGMLWIPSSSLRNWDDPQVADRSFQPCAPGGWFEGR